MKNYEVQGFHYKRKKKHKFTFFIALPDLKKVGKPKMRVSKIFPVFNETKDIYLFVVILRHFNINDRGRYMDFEPQTIEVKTRKLKGKFPQIPVGKKIGIITIHEEDVPLHKHRNIFEQAFGEIIKDPNSPPPKGWDNFYNRLLLAEHIKKALVDNGDVNASEPLETGNGGTVDPIP